jgi:hypothetical protein
VKLIDILEKIELKGKEVVKKKKLFPLNEETENNEIINK